MNDSAEFSCLAENSFGRANATIVLIVEVSIEINDIPIKETVARATFSTFFRKSKRHIIVKTQVEKFNLKKMEN